MLSRSLLCPCRLLPLPGGQRRPDAAGWALLLRLQGQQQRPARAAWGGGARAAGGGLHAAAGAAMPPATRAAARPRLQHAAAGRAARGWRGGRQGFRQSCSRPAGCQRIPARPPPAPRPQPCRSVACAAAAAVSPAAAAVVPAMSLLPGALLMRAGEVQAAAGRQDRLPRPPADVHPGQEQVQHAQVQVKPPPAVEQLLCSCLVLLYATQMGDCCSSL